MILTGQIFFSALIIDQFCQTFTLQSARFWSGLGFSFYIWIWYKILLNEIFTAEYTKARIYSSSRKKIHFLSKVYLSRLLILSTPLKKTHSDLSLSNSDISREPTGPESRKIPKFRKNQIEILHKNYPRKKFSCLYNTFLIFVI